MVCGKLWSTGLQEEHIYDILYQDKGIQCVGKCVIALVLCVYCIFVNQDLAILKPVTSDVWQEIINMENHELNKEKQPSIFPGTIDLDLDLDVNELSQKTLKAVLKATKSSNTLPVGDDFDFYSTFRTVRDVLDIEGRRILSLLQRLLRHQNVKGNLNQDVAELEDQFDVLLDANDQILERTGTLLDEASGIHKEETKLIIASASPVSFKATSSWNQKPVVDAGKSATAYRLMTARNIQRPQLSFRDKIDNSNLPFKPQLRSKPNALKSLEESLKLPDGVNLEETERPNFVYPHPYSFELDSFKPDPKEFEHVAPQDPQPLSITPLIIVDTLKMLQEMIDHLRTQTVFAVDLEHHSYRSFQGFTCLMQISTRSHDYIVDTLELRNDLYILNEIFTDVNITKVFHGADSDIVWLQRDFGIYVVNMFDTGQAARVLGFSRFSLAHLLKNYCKIEADKQFQLADWRIRPLPSELINYAREDTHYLLYIYDSMKNQLLDRGNSQNNLLLSVYERSKIIAGKVYQKPVFTENDYKELYKKSKKVFNNQQMAALRDIFAWRDLMARMEDESLGYVLPNHMLLQIAEILPRERQGVLACCNPIPPLVRQSLIELHNMVLQARELDIYKLEKPVQIQSSFYHPKYDADNFLNCPHDMTRLDEKMVDIEKKILETGLVSSTASMLNQRLSGVAIKVLPIISAFSIRKDKKKDVSQILAEEVRSCFSNPFLKYLPPRDVSISSVEKEIWNLKPSTVVQGNKRKADSLENLSPIYAPPKKKMKNEASSCMFQSTQSTGIGASNCSEETIVNPVKIKDNTTAEIVEKKLMSIRQEASQKKKKEKKKNICQELKTKAETENLNNASCSSVINTESNMRNEKVKRSKKKLTVTDVEQSFQPFDYSVAETSCIKDSKKKKPVDIFNPSLPSRSNKHKDKTRKPKLSGPRSNVSLTFGCTGKESKKMK